MKNCPSSFSRHLNISLSWVGLGPTLSLSRKTEENVLSWWKVINFPLRKKRHIEKGERREKVFFFSNATCYCQAVENSMVFLPLLGMSA